MSGHQGRTCDPRDQHLCLPLRSGRAECNEPRTSHVCQPVPALSDRPVNAPDGDFRRAPQVVESPAPRGVASATRPEDRREAHFDHRRIDGRSPKSYRPRDILPLSTAGSCYRPPDARGFGGASGAPRQVQSAQSLCNFHTIPSPFNETSGGTCSRRAVMTRGTHSPMPLQRHSCLPPCSRPTWSSQSAE